MTTVDGIQKQVDVGNNTAGVLVDLKKAFGYSIIIISYLKTLITMVLKVLQKIGFISFFES